MRTRNDAHGASKPLTWNGVAVPYDADLDELRWLIEDPGSARDAAFVALAHSARAGALELLGGYAHAADRRMRRAAVEAIGRHAEGVALAAAVVERLADADTSVACAACGSAAALRIGEAHDAVVALLHAEVATVRTAAASALGALWVDGDFEEVLAVCRTDESAAVREEAAWVLRETASARTWSRLFDAWCRDALPRHRVWACELATRWGGPDELPALQRMLDDCDGHVRAAAATAVKRFARG